MLCRICGAKTRIIEDGQFQLQYRACDACRYIGIDLDKVLSFEDERTEYDRHENSIYNEGYVQFFVDFLEGAVMPYMNKKGLCLDYGSGPEPVLQQILIRDYNLEVDIYDLHYQPEKVFEGKRYDTILTTEVIEHIAQPKAFFEEVTTHLKKGGILAIMTLFHEDDDEAFLRWWYRRDVTHIGFFRVETFERLAEMYGMTLLYTDHKRYITLQKL